MVGIVVVAHSRALARAAVALAEEMVRGQQLRIGIAAGLDERSFGTDAVAICEAITAADDGSGVVVLMDLGSAVLSAELALDLLDEQVRARVVLCPAPLVEGLVVAAVSAASGANRDVVAAEASAALAAKLAHLSPGDATGGVRAGGGQGGASGMGDHVAEPAGDAAVGVFTVRTRHGLHARPAARLVQEVGRLEAQVELRNLTTGAGPVSGRSLSRVATLAALPGHEVEVRATGSQAREALEHILALAARDFDEQPDTVAVAGAVALVAPARQGRTAAPTVGPPAEGSTALPVNPAPGGPWTGLPVSPGIGIGPARSLRSGVPEVPDACSDDPPGQWRRLQEALAAARRQIRQVRSRTRRDLGEDEAAIFDAHLLMLQDSDLLDDVHARIGGGQAAAPAWAAVVKRVAAELAALPDPYLQARAADVRAVGDQVLRELLGVTAVRARPHGVLVAPDLTPAEAAELDPDAVRAVVLAFGSPTAHSAILARARGIPCVVGAGPGVLSVPDGSVLAVDGQTGEVVPDPSPELLAELRARADQLAGRRAAAMSRAGQPAVTRHGVSVLVGANLGGVDEARVAAGSGADLAGLVRTEFLFLGRADAPDVDEQEKAYRAIAEAMGGRRITLRTLDVGGDKSLDYLPTAPEANPFLGVRGLRLSLTQPAMLTEQLLAMVRVAHEAPVSVMFPMVAAVSELARARELLDEAIRSDGRGMPTGLQVGIMVEVPATALKTAAFAGQVDFFSIGTNDLTQYALAAERGNDSVAALGDPLDPGVLHLIAAVCRQAGGATVAVCGELAADEAATGVLVGLGVRELSVAPPAVPGIKEAVRSVDQEAAGLATRALSVAGPAEVRAVLRPTPE